MKTSVFITLTIFCSYFQFSLAQSFPAKFNYQVSIRDDKGTAISDRLVSFRISIIENQNTPNIYAYKEEHKDVSTKFGIASFIIGDSPNKTGIIENLLFQSKAYHIRVEIDENNGSNYKDLVTAQLVSVPYAMVASQLSQNNAKQGEVLKWNGTEWIPDTDISSPGGGVTNLAGDVTGTVTNTKVEKIQNRTLASTTPNIGQVLKWNGSQWGPDNDATGGAPTNLNGDVTGSPTNNKVEKIQNRTVASTTPTTGQVLKWNGSQWSPDNDATGGAPTNLSGDVTGTPTNNKVEKIQNRPVASTAPTTGQVLKWNGSQWVPDNVSGGGTNPWTQSTSTFYNNGNNKFLISNSTTSTINNQSSDNYPGLQVRYFDRFIAMGFEYAAGNPFVAIGHNNNIFARFGRNPGTQKYEFICEGVKCFKTEHPFDATKSITYACVEGPEAAAYERGTVQMINGEAVVNFSEHFKMIINPKTLTTIVTPLSSKSKGIAVIEKSCEGIILKELKGGKGNYQIDWEVKAVRKGFEDFQVIRNKDYYLGSPTDFQK
ncbi:MAG TPA: hypothetical protein PLS73_10275 [Saprospiraceae bacterium]|nr:hypothetical protein [Saprospiraceae bacterium]